MGLSVVIREVKVGDDASSFRTLNEEWIVRFFSLEEKDRELLGDPENTILRRGGHIFMASHKGENVGCVALLPLENGIYELSKMAVLPRLRNQRIGHQLLAHVISEARLLGAVSLCLATNTKLKNAIHLYEAVGFLHVSREELPPLPYTRANVFLALTLGHLPR
jgi:N-acetylglutamate synthase-like GNAT family acetyltransferase